MFSCLSVGTPIPRHLSLGIVFGQVVLASQGTDQGCSEYPLQDSPCIREWHSPLCQSSQSWDSSLFTTNQDGLSLVCCLTAPRADPSGLWGCSWLTVGQLEELGPRIRSAPSASWLCFYSWNDCSCGTRILTVVIGCKSVCGKLLRGGSGLFVCFLFFVELGIEPSVLCMLGKYCTAGL